jgi:hypothetical protein
LHTNTLQQPQEYTRKLTQNRDHTSLHTRHQATPSCHRVTTPTQAHNTTVQRYKLHQHLILHRPTTTTYGSLGKSSREPAHRRVFALSTRPTNATAHNNTHQRRMCHCHPSYMRNTPRCGPRVPTRSLSPRSNTLAVLTARRFVGTTWTSPRTTSARCKRLTPLCVEGCCGLTDHQPVIHRITTTFDARVSRWG